MFCSGDTEEIKTSKFRYYDLRSPQVGIWTRAIFLFTRPDTITDPGYLEVRNLKNACFIRPKGKHCWKKSIAESNQKLISYTSHLITF